jgi:hypothetical protein
MTASLSTGAPHRRARPLQYRFPSLNIAVHSSSALTTPDCLLRWRALDLSREAAVAPVARAVRDVEAEASELATLAVEGQAPGQPAPSQFNLSRAADPKTPTWALLNYPTFSNSCARQGSNLHALRRWNLKAVRPSRGVAKRAQDGHLDWGLAPGGHRSDLAQTSRRRLRGVLGWPDQAAPAIPGRAPPRCGRRGGRC